MKRNNKTNSILYQGTCEKVMERADNLCEVMLEGKRCGKFIHHDTATYSNFAHTDSRNGQSDEWINDPENIIFSCAEHHLEEHRTGEKLKRCDYSEINYIPCED